MHTDLDTERAPMSGAHHRDSRTSTVRPRPVAFLVGPGASFHGRGPSIPLRDARRSNFDFMIDPRSASLEDVLIERIDQDPRPRPRGNRPSWVARQLGEFMHVDGDVLGLAQVIDEAKRRGVLDQFDLSWWLTAWRAA